LLECPFTLQLRNAAILSLGTLSLLPQLFNLCE
jgi:hypothetical protein